MFIKGRVAVTESGVIAESEITPDMNVVFIYPKMPYSVKQAVTSAAMKVDVRSAAKRGKANGAAPDVDFNLGQWNVSLLLHNIVHWQGPAFAEYPYSHDMKMRLAPMIDDSEPLWTRVIAELVERNKPKESPNAVATSSGA